jgi:hypothetical protein
LRPARQLAAGSLTWVAAVLGRWVLPGYPEKAEVGYFKHLDATSIAQQRWPAFSMPP